jgi:hypothetical protein
MCGCSWVALFKSKKEGAKMILEPSHIVVSTKPTTILTRLLDGILCSKAKGRI